MLCKCGCGQETKLSDRSDAKRGVVRGQPLNYVNGHSCLGRRKVAEPYRVEDRGYDTPCWIWQRNVNPVTGYGEERRRIGHRTYDRALAHRWVYEQERGPIPAGLTLDHLCKERACVNPDHLEPVTNAENSRRGLRTRLTWDIVNEMRASGETNRALARRFGVHESHVSRIRGYKVWVAA